MTEIKEQLIINKNGTITGTTAFLFNIWSKQDEMGIEMIGQIPLCG